jgi:RNA polymerase sigma-54 factor
MMRFDASQQMRLGQQMKLAPRMIQSMEILQMPLLALQERIEQELESNITLEAWEPTGNREEIDRQREEEERAAREGERELRVDETSGAEDFERLATYEHDNPEIAENEYSSSVRDARVDWEPPARAKSDGERDAKMDAMANTAARGESLEEQLLEQWGLADVEDGLREPGRLIIQWIDADGYLRTDLARIAAESPVRGGAVDVPTLERALVAVQTSMDPPGIGARDVRECLLLQVDALVEEEPGTDWSVVRRLIADHLDDLIHNRIPRVAERSGLSVEQIREAMEQMKRLSVHPGRRLVIEAPQTIIPDAIVEYVEEGDEYIAYLADNRLPNLRVNREYALMSKSKDLAKHDREFIRTNLSNAQWLIDAVGQRRQTLLRVLRAVVSAQRDVFDMGWEALRPLPMTQVADQLGIHVATVSRAVAGKWVQTPRGVFPLRKFFTGGTQNDAGEDVSWDAIKAAMREVVDGEDKKDPLSDDAIVKELKAKGIEIARRTVAKYRGQLDIPPARMRKQF